MPDDRTLERIELHMQRGNELLTRIDAHLERGIQDTSPEHLARGAEFERRLAEHVARCEEVITGTGQAYDEWRFSMRQDSLRNERILGQMSNAIGEQVAEFRRRTDDVIAEGKAQRAALWKILDKLTGDDGPAPAAG